MIELEQAWELLFEKVEPLGSESCEIDQAVGRTAAEDILSPIDVSPFRNSAMDGFAVRAEWLRGCSETAPVTLPIGATVNAGDGIPTGVTGRYATKVMTGAPVPDECDAVVKFEDTEYNENEVRFAGEAVAGQHVRPPGEDVIRGQKLFARGECLGQLDIGIMAGVGLSSISVYRQPKVLVAGTGSELVEPGRELGPGKIFDANSYTMQAMIGPLCGSVECFRRVTDEPDALEEILGHGHDVIVTSGGVSMGERDLVVDIAESLGWQSVFHKAKIKPGKPIYFAVRGRQLLFGLPGNPLSTAVTCAIMVLPALKKLVGRTDYRLKPVPARLEPSSVRKTVRKLIWPGFIKHSASGTVAEFSSKKSSAALTAVLRTDGLIFQSPAASEQDDVTVGVVPWNQVLNN